MHAVFHVVFELVISWFSLLLCEGKRKRKNYLFRSNRDSRAIIMITIMVIVYVDVVVVV